MPPTKPTVFVVDDDASVRNSLKLLVESAGWAAETFASGDAFLSRLPVRPPSCLVLDVVMPDGNGCDLQASIVGRATLPIIFISGHADVGTTVRTMKAGARDFLIKPFPCNVMLDAIQDALHSSAGGSSASTAPKLRSPGTEWKHRQPAETAMSPVRGQPNEPGKADDSSAARAASDERRALERRGMAARLEERMRERERIARELHDTLLQGTQALLMSVHALSSRIPAEDPMHQMLSATLERANAVMAAGRDRIHSLRAAMNSAIDLPKGLASAWQELGGSGELRVRVDGAHRLLKPDTGDEILLIAREALANAHRHACAKAIDAHIVFSSDRLRLSVRDDGIGLRREVIGTGSRKRHWGIAGMHERAERIFANLEIRSAPGAGTVVVLVVPAACAYR